MIFRTKTFLHNITTCNPNWLQGNPRTVTSGKLCSSFRKAYCQVKPQKEAVLTITKIFPKTIRAFNL